tara:strand:+ start:157 stop:609 length:453 start_codon:yes stop_codon:yes gene_type:complete
MTKSDKEFDYSKLLTLLDEEKLQNVGKELASQALNNIPIEYEDCYVQLTVPSTVIRLLETLTEIFPVDMETILSKMATQGLNNILQGVTQPPENEKDINILDDIEPINKISDQLSDLQTVIGRFSDMQKIFGDLTSGANLNNAEQDKEDP